MAVLNHPTRSEPPRASVRELPPKAVGDGHETSIGDFEPTDATFVLMADGSGCGGGSVHRRLIAVERAGRLRSDRIRLDGGRDAGARAEGSNGPGTGGPIPTVGTGDVGSFDGESQKPPYPEPELFWKHCTCEEGVNWMIVFTGQLRQDIPAVLNVVD